MKVIYYVIYKNFESLIYMSFVFFVIIMMYVLLGMRIYRNNLESSFTNSNFNFKKIWPSFFLILKIILLSDWYNLMMKISLKNSILFFDFIFFIMLIIVGNFIVLNLFITIIIDSFKFDEDFDFDNFEIDEETKTILLKNIVNKHHQENLEDVSLFDLNDSDEDESSNKDEFFSKSNDEFLPSSRKNLNKNSSKMESSFVKIPSGKKFSKKDILFLYKNNQNSNRININVPSEYSLFFFDKNNLFRKLCFLISSHHYFNKISFFFIILSTMKIMMETFYDKTDKDDLAKILKLISKYLSYLINFFFTFVVIIKSIAVGFISKPKSFCRDFLNIINLFACLGFYLALTSKNLSVDITKVFKCFKNKLYTKLIIFIFIKYLKLYFISFYR